MRHRIGIGQHAETDAQSLDRCQALGRRQQRRNQDKGPFPGRGKPVADSSRVAPAGPIALPQQGSHAFEPARGHQFLDRVPAHDQPAGLAVDFTHHRVGDDHAVEATVHPCLQHRIPLVCTTGNVDPRKYIVNLDCIDQYITWHWNF